MVRSAVLFAILWLGCSGPATANAWEDNYNTVPNSEGVIPSSDPPEIIGSTGDAERDLETMWRRGYALIGYTYFKSNNSKTSDGMKLAKKLRARYLIVNTSLAASRTAAIPFTSPTSSTTTTSGTASVFGSGGSATGHYSATSTTYGSETKYVPITINTFDKIGAYFREVPKVGAGIFFRELTAEEMAAIETRKAVVVKWVRDGSPAYHADIFPGDMLLKVNGQPIEPTVWSDALRAGDPVKLGILRNGQPREIFMTVPVEWRPN